MLRLGKKKSGFPLIVFVCIVQPQMPARTSMARNRASVVRFPLPRMADIRREWVASTSPNVPPTSFSLSARST